MATPELLAQLTALVSSGATSVGPDKAAVLEEVLDRAIALVDNECGASKDLVPTVVLDGAYVELGAELYNRRSAPNGITQFAASDGSAMRVRMDPLDAVRPQLRPFLPGGFA